MLAVTAFYCAAEFLGGYLTNSLALISDAVHMLTDIAALCLSLLMLWISARPATAGKTFGYLRAEILGAFLNGLFLWLLVAFIWIEAASRLQSPQAVSGLPVMGIALIGLAVNTFSAWMTYDAGGESGSTGMAVKAVFVHVISDLIGVSGVLVSGALIYFTGWTKADPVVSFVIGALVLYSSWGLVREGVDILMESVPSNIDLDQLRSDLLAVEGTTEVHDLHVWCLTAREFALSAHAVISSESDHDRVLSDMHQVLGEKFNIRHMTVQLERDNRRDREPEHFSPRSHSRSAQRRRSRRGPSSRSGHDKPRAILAKTQSASCEFLKRIQSPNAANADFFGLLWATGLQLEQVHQKYHQLYTYRAGAAIHTIFMVNMTNDQDFFREFEHTADAGIEVEAPSRADLFACAAIGLARMMVAPHSIEPREHRMLEVEASCDEDLMHDALSAALDLFVFDGFIWRDAAVEERRGGLTLKLTGAPFDHRRHELLTELKSVAHNQLTVERSQSGWTARVMFDV